MNRDKINKGFMALFESKGIKNYNNTIDVWIGLCERYNLKEDDIIKAIDRLILEQTPYRLEFAQLLEKINNTDKAGITEKIEIQWQKILEKCRGNNSDIDDLACKCFLMITDFEKYGYSENDFEKSKWYERWKELYKTKLETGNYNTTQIASDIKKMLKFKDLERI